MSAIGEFYLARLDERERAAKACAETFPGPWEVSDRGWLAKVTAGAPDFRTVTELEQYTGGPVWLGDQLQHIAFHDPASVLADIAAKRRIVELHEQWPVLVERPPELVLSDPSDLGSMSVKMTQQIRWATEQEYRNRFGDEPPTSPIMRALVSVYADHPDFQEIWR